MNNTIAVLQRKRRGGGQQQEHNNSCHTARLRQQKGSELLRLQLQKASHYDGAVTNWWNPPLPPLSTQ